MIGLEFNLKEMFQLVILKILAINANPTLL